VQGLRRLFLAVLVVAFPASAQPQSWGWDDGTVPYVQTPMEIVERMLRMAEVGKGDHLIDLGSGDGRIVIEAAKRGATGLGVDLDGSLVKHATENAQKAGVGERARFEVRDFFETDLSRATVVAFYLLPEFNAKLLPRLLKLKPGTRIVSHDGGIGDWPPDERLEMRAPEKPVGVGGVSRVELWIVPADARGAWTSEVPLALRGEAEIPGAGHRRGCAGQGPAGAQQPPAWHRDQDRGYRPGRRARLPPLLRGPDRRRPHRRRALRIRRQ
jgi:SAM-dependent methyltransferase